MDGIGGIVAEKCDWIVFENVEKLNDVHAAGTRRRHGKDIVATIGAVHRCTHHGPVVVQIVERDQTAVRRHVGGNFPGNVAAVKRIGSCSAIWPEGLRQITLHESLTTGQCGGIVV